MTIDQMHNPNIKIENLALKKIIGNLLRLMGKQEVIINKDDFMNTNASFEAEFSDSHCKITALNLNKENFN